MSKEGYTYVIKDGNEVSIKELMSPCTAWRVLRTRHRAYYLYEFDYRGLVNERTREVEHRVRRMLRDNGIIARMYVSASVAAEYSSFGLIVGHVMRVRLKILNDAQLELMFDMVDDALRGDE